MPNGIRYYGRLVHGSYLDRMVLFRDVGWVRNVDGSYTVTWTQNGEPQAATFRKESSAVRFANMLDTTGTLPTEGDVIEAEHALLDLETTAFPESAADRRARVKAEAALAELEAAMAQLERDELLQELEEMSGLERGALRRRADQPVRKHTRRLQELK